MTRNLDTASIALFIGGLSLPLGAGKVIPGGPFISLSGDLIPFTLALFAIWCSLPYIAHQLWKIKTSALAHTVIATALLAFVLMNVIGFYLDPYARGNVFRL